jgi:hypothetical protein
MEIAILIFAGCAAWFGYQIYLGYLRKDMRDKFQAASAAPAADAKTQQRPKELKWSGEVSGPLPIKMLTRPQWECLSDGSEGRQIVAVTPFERFDARDDGRCGHPMKTITALEKHGMLFAGKAGVYQITDIGLRAYETLSVRY